MKSHKQYTKTDPAMSEGLIRAMRESGVPKKAVDDILDLHQDMTATLHPDLEGCVYEEPGIGLVLKHPLVFQIPFSLPGQANFVYQQKTEVVKGALGKGDLSTVIWMHERPYRLVALIECVVGRNAGGVLPLIDCEQRVRDLAADVWVDSENIHQNIEDWTALFEGWECGDDMLFCDDPEGFAALPDPLTVFRAGIDDGGWSWTLDRKVAEFFANRFRGDHAITERRVPKNCVFGYLTRRNEAEVLVHA